MLLAAKREAIWQEAPKPPPPPKKKRKAHRWQIEYRLIRNLHQRTGICERDKCRGQNCPKRDQR